LYVGETVSSARLVAVSAAPSLVGDVARRLADGGELPADDEVTRVLEMGRRAALRLVAKRCREVGQ